MFCSNIVMITMRESWCVSFDFQQKSDLSVQYQLIVALLNFLSTTLIFFPTLTKVVLWPDPTVSESSLSHEFAISLLFQGRTAILFRPPRGNVNTIPLRQCSLFIITLPWCCHSAGGGEISCLVSRQHILGTRRYICCRPVVTQLSWKRCPLSSAAALWLSSPLRTTAETLSHSQVTHSLVHGDVSSISTIMCVYSATLICLTVFLFFKWWSVDEWLFPELLQCFRS